MYANSELVNIADQGKYTSIFVCVTITIIGRLLHKIDVPLES